MVDVNLWLISPRLFIWRRYHFSSQVLLFEGTTTINEPGFINQGLTLTCLPWLPMAMPIQWWTEGAINGAFGVSIFPRNIPQSNGEPWSYLEFPNYLIDGGCEIYIHQSLSDIFFRPCLMNRSSDLSMKILRSRRVRYALGRHDTERFCPSVGSLSWIFHNRYGGNYELLVDTWRWVILSISFYSLGISPCFSKNQWFTGLPWFTHENITHQAL